MTNKERIVQVLADEGQPLCDACLTEMARITNRQVAYMVCNDLHFMGVTHREKGGCTGCGKNVICNRVVGMPGFLLSRPSEPPQQYRLTRRRGGAPAVPAGLAQPTILWPRTEPRVLRRARSVGCWVFGVGCSALGVGRG